MHFRLRCTLTHRCTCRYYYCDPISESIYALVTSQLGTTDNVIFNPTTGETVCAMTCMHVFIDGIRSYWAVLG